MHRQGEIARRGEASCERSEIARRGEASREHSEIARRVARWGE
jgi:hypothetical protein